jgi:hypothetical protein
VEKLLPPPVTGRVAQILLTRFFSSIPSTLASARSRGLRSREARLRGPWDSVASGLITTRARCSLELAREFFFSYLHIHMQLARRVS